MIRLPTRTLFRLLSIGIGVLALVLMGLVGLMLYEAFTAPPPNAPVLPQVAEMPKPDWQAPMVNSANVLHSRLHPKGIDVPPPPPPTVDKHGGYRQVGVYSSPDASYVMLQNERTKEPVTLRVGQEKIVGDAKMTATAVDVLNGTAVVSINGQPANIKRVDALIVQPTVVRGAPGMPGGPAAGARTGTPGTTAAPTGSIRVISGGGTISNSSSGEAAASSRGGRTSEQWRSELERIRREQRARSGQ